MDSQLEGGPVTRTRSRFRIPDKLIVVHNSDSESQILENLPQQETQTDLPQINQPVNILDTQINIQAAEHQDNIVEQMGSNISIPALRNDTQEL